MTRHSFLTWRAFRVFLHAHKKMSIAFQLGHCEHALDNADHDYLYTPATTLKPVVYHLLDQRRGVPVVASALCDWHYDHFSLWKTFFRRLPTEMCLYAVCRECSQKHKKDLLDPLRELLEELESKCLAVYQKRYEAALRNILFGDTEKEKETPRMWLEHDEHGAPLVMGAPREMLEARTPMMTEIMRAVTEARENKDGETSRHGDMALRVECDKIHAGVRLCREVLFGTGTATKWDVVSEPPFSSALPPLKKQRKLETT